MKLTYVKRDQKTSKAGKPYTSLSIKTEQHGDRFINGFGNKENEGWKVGDEVEVNVSEKEYNGKMYLNLEMPKIADKVNDLAKEFNSIGFKLGVIGVKIDKIIGHLAGHTRLDVTSNGKPLPDFDRKPVEQKVAEDINVDDIPF
jgi:hypothetical protein